MLVTVPPPAPWPGLGGPRASDASRHLRPAASPSTPAAVRRIHSSSRTAGSGLNRMQSASASAPAATSAAEHDQGRGHGRQRAHLVAATARATPALANAAGSMRPPHPPRRQPQHAPGEGQVADVAEHLRGGDGRGDHPYPVGPERQREQDEQGQPQDVGRLDGQRPVQLRARVRQQLGELGGDVAATREREPGNQPDGQAPLGAEHDLDQLLRRHGDSGADREQHQVAERQDAEVGASQAGQVLLDAAEGREQHVGERLGQVVAERLEDQVVRAGVLAEDCGAGDAGHGEGVQVAADVVHQVGAREARPVAAHRAVRLPAEHRPERMPHDDVLPHRLDRCGGQGGRHQAPHAGPEQGQADAHDEVGEDVGTHRDDRQNAEAELAAQQAQAGHGPAHEHE